MWSLEAKTLQDFYVALFKNAAERWQEVRPARENLAKSRRRIMEQICDQNLQSEIDLLLEGVGFLLYRRGHEDAESRRKAANPIRRTPERHKRFNRAVTRMLEHDIEMEIEKICAVLDRQGVTGHFKIRGSDEEIGPHGFPWTNKPIPGAVTEAIERIRANVVSENNARTRQSLLSSTANDRPRAATQES